MERKTKIIATLGPATNSPQSIGKILTYGTDLVRLNFSHGTVAEHKKRVKIVRQWTKKHKKEIGVIADLQGPKIRIGKFKTSSIKVKKGQNFTIDTNLRKLGDETTVGINYKALIKDIKKNDTLLLDDGLISLKVKSVSQTKIKCIVLNSGTLSDHKGLNRQGGGLAACSLTRKDFKDIDAALKMDVDFIAISFIKSASDIKRVQKIIAKSGTICRVIAKIERKEAIDNIDEIIKASDGVLVARGDLGIEVGVEEVPALQKMIIKKAMAFNKAAITATQMMESMRKNQIPTRAEVSDVANAILDETDAVMLSAETSTGLHPDLVIKTVDSICKSVEQYPIAYSEKYIEKKCVRNDEAIAIASMFIANNLSIHAIIALTESGSTALWMSRVRSQIPIYGLSKQTKTLRIMNLYRNVYPMCFDSSNITPKLLEKKAIKMLKTKNSISDNARIIMTKGDIMGKTGETNSLKIISS